MPSRSPLFLALDQGGHATRVLVFDAKGELVATAERLIATLHPGRNRVEHDPVALLASVRQVCQKIAKQLGTHAARIRCAGLATQRSTLVCWERQTGTALSPIISWQDRRAAGKLRRLASHAKRVHAISGLVLSPHYGANKLAWCLARLPAVRHALKQRRLAAGPLASFILANLLEEKPLLVDPVNASRTLLWNYRTCGWSPKLMRLFGIPHGILPKCVPNKYAFGHLMLGRYPIPLTVVTGDQPASLYSQGHPDKRSIYVNLGTGAFIQHPHGATPPHAVGMLSSVLWQDRRRVLYVLEGTVNGAGSALTWLRKQLGVSEQDMLAGIPGWLAAPSEAPLFLNGVSGLGSPYWLADFHSRFIGRGNSGQKFLAVLESIVFLLCQNLERMRKLGQPARGIVASGGLAQWDGVCQRLADLSGLPLHRARMHEATARGLARLLGANPATGTKVRAFRPQNNATLKDRYTRWCTALQQHLTL